MEVIQLGPQFNNETLVRITRGKQVWLCCSEVRSKIVPRFLASSFRMAVSKHAAPRLADQPELKFLQDEGAIEKSARCASLVDLEATSLALRELLGNHIIVESFSSVATAVGSQEAAVAALEPSLLGTSLNHCRPPFAALQLRMKAHVLGSFPSRLNGYFYARKCAKPLNGHQWH